MFNSSLARHKKTGVAGTDGDEGARGMDAACCRHENCRFLCASTECACLLKVILMLDLNTCLLVLFALILAAVMKLVVLACAPLRTWCLLHISRGM